MTEREALKLALECVERCESIDGMYSWADTITTIKEALAQPEQKVDWEKLYRLEVKKKEALAAKYERDIKPLTKIVPMAQPDQEPVAWPCVIAEADFSGNTVTLTMQCTDYKVSAGKHWLSNTPPQRTWVWLTDEEERQIKEHCTTVACVLKTVKAKLKGKNT